MTAHLANLSIDSIQKIEVELSSRCNAACPGCLRTILKSEKKTFPEKDLPLDLLIRSFENLEIQDKEFKLCGVLGDPMAHPQAVDVVRWLLDRGARVEISTNASLGTKTDWEVLGELSKKTRRLMLHFSVDGLEGVNEIYRVKTNFRKITENIKRYCEQGGLGNWIFIEFDHNIHQREAAQKMAQSFNLGFASRRAIRNSFPGVKGVDSEKKVGSFGEKISHNYLSDAERIMKAPPNELSSNEIKCKYAHQGELFISADGRLWPCCFLWDEYIGGKNNFPSRLAEWVGSKNWNDLAEHSIESILGSQFYAKLDTLWQEGPHFTKRCYKSCGSQGKLQNSLSLS